MSCSDQPAVTSCSQAGSSAVPYVGTDSPVIPALPMHLQPGLIRLPDPRYAGMDALPFIENDNLVGYPLRSGRQVVVGCGNGWSFVQDSGRVVFDGYEDGSVTPRLFAGNEMRAALRVAAVVFRGFVLEGELTYLDWEERPYPSAAEALSENRRSASEAPILPYLRIRRALWVGGDDLAAGDTPESHRAYSGQEIARFLAENYPDAFRPIHAAFTAAEKRVLVSYTRKHGHRELWIDGDAPFSSQASFLTGDPCKPS